MDIETLADNFELLGPWEERYRYLIDLGRQLEPMPEAEKTEQTRVRGCMSQVWLTHEISAESPPKLHFRGDSDAHIVKGLIALLARSPPQAPSANRATAMRGERNLEVMGSNCRSCDFGNAT